MLNEQIIVKPRVQTWSLQTLLRFMVVVLLGFGLGCVYFSQVNAVSTIRDETSALQARTQDLERQNISLMVQVAAWTRPGNVRAKALEQGLVPLGAPAVVALSEAAGPAADADVRLDLATRWEQLITALASRWPAQ